MQGVWGRGIYLFCFVSTSNPLPPPKPITLPPPQKKIDLTTCWNKQKYKSSPLFLNVSSLYVYDFYTTFSKK